MVIIDIGCGQKKIPGSIGIDLSEFSDADHILNLNTEALPFDDDSVDYVHTSHFLEHLEMDGFFHILKEIYRVVKSEGKIFIAVPYFNHPINLANPFHNNRICFNEHTFRFFHLRVKPKHFPRIDIRHVVALNGA